MAKYTDQEIANLTKRAKKVLEELPKQDSDVAYEYGDVVRNLSEMPPLDHLPVDQVLGPRGERGTVADALKLRDQLGARVHGLVDTFDEQPTPPVDHGEARMRTEKGNPDRFGNRIIETTFADGHVETEVIDGEAFDAAWAERKKLLDTASDTSYVVTHPQVYSQEQVQEARATRITLRDELAAAERKRAEEEIAAAVASGEMNEQEASRARGKIERDLRQMLRKDFGFAPHEMPDEPLPEGVEEVLALAKAGKVDSLYARLPDDPIARQHIWRELDATPELRAVREALLTEESEIRTARSQALREAGVLG